MPSRLNYYIKAGVRRKLLDKMHLKYSKVYKGVVLDVGGRDRGKFKKPKEQVEKWIFADIEPNHQPDLVLDVANMHQVKSESIDVISAIELFEHVKEIEKGLKECQRVLKTNGKILIAVPFLCQIHGDPSDYQRWTLEKWKMELENLGLQVKEIEIMGRFFSLSAHLFRTFVHSLPVGIKHLMYFFFPIVDLMVRLDNSKWVLNHRKLSNFHGGYFIVAEKQNHKAHF